MNRSAEYNPGTGAIAGSSGDLGDLVSVVIPCYGQARFLPEALDSVLAQTYGAFEVVVVDDGSPDETSAVVAEYTARDPRVRGFRQENRGLSGARNAGLARTRGDYVVFLDADDMLCPTALASGIEALRAHPEAAFASGRFEFMGYYREPLENPDEIGRIEGDPYAALLRVNQIAVPAMVMYRRWVFHAAGAFDAATTPAEDYDLYLKIVRRFPICTHETVVARYRQYGCGLSANSARMGHAIMRIMDRQRPYVAGNPVLERARREGVRFWQRFYFTRAARSAISRSVFRGEWDVLLAQWPIVLRWGPLAVARYIPELAGRVLSRRNRRGVRGQAVA